jgi:hypothetical protein
MAQLFEIADKISVATAPRRLGERRRRVDRDPAGRVSGAQMNTQNVRRR